mgnify:CR=1 FL=1|tara:strand:- start:644 stop:826 length:183 start_codon:yes stop_codon:yes gene_type:complete
MKAKEFCCIDCGSDDLEFQVWVNEHDDIVNNCSDQIWCNDCYESVSAIYKDEYKLDYEEN